MRIHLKIHGRVQGVGFRAWTARSAEQFEVSGWVMNMKDGTVEAFLSGSPDKVSAFHQKLFEGPRHAKVSEIEILSQDEPGSGDGEPGQFEIRYG